MSKIESEAEVLLAVQVAFRLDSLWPSVPVLHTCDRHRHSWHASCLFRGLYLYSLLVVAEIRYRLRPDLMLIQSRPADLLTWRLELWPWLPGPPERPSFQPLLSAPSPGQFLLECWYTRPGVRSISCGSVPCHTLRLEQPVLYLPLHTWT